MIKQVPRLVALMAITDGTGNEILESALRTAAEALKDRMGRENASVRAAIRMENDPLSLLTAQRGEAVPIIAGMNQNRGYPTERARQSVTKAPRFPNIDARLPHPNSKSLFFFGRSSFVVPCRPKIADDEEADHRADTQDAFDEQDVPPLKGTENRGGIDQGMPANGDEQPDNVLAHEYLED